ncbi:MAG: CBS domain-containing protein [Thermoplasmata archaeon]|nr:MAG: CBS domain-containing protein [Thermoplasmata archaeon]HDH81627.1 CBS domain-containing protein [Thermoplasmatales archaeon]MCD6146507.1 CBS domain-containing protein [Thermoplasmata archaeon]RLF43689.1 MAG: CBS domain-containing protein [Thermoplasmata archaeon]RLF49261.1 MAG: CBS domain-containing protein [Thermoplasmata archaeon]
MKGKLKVKDVMTTDIIVAEVPGNREDVLRMFGKYEISGMPVVKAGTRKLAGVITRNDLFRNSDEAQLAMIMNDNPVTISPDDDIKKAAKIFYEKRIHGLPVVENGEVVGIVSPSDILRLIERFDGDEVDGYLSPIFVPVYEETPLPVVMKIFRVTDAGALPVLDGEGMLSGIVADGDLFTFSHLDENVVKSEMGIGEDEDVWSWEGIRDVMRLYYETSKIQLPPIPVKEVMVKDVITVFRKTTLSAVAQKMLDNKINQMPVMDEGNEIMGIVCDIDLMKTLI